MAAVIRTLTPLMTKTQSQKKLLVATNGGEKQTLLHRDRRCTALCCRGQQRKGLTFAVEPIKLALSESLEGLNK